MHEEQKLKEEVDVWVVTQGGIHIGTDLNRGECSGTTFRGKDQESSVGTSQV
jgi:hypothetical protein